MLAYVDKLNELDTGAVAPTTRVGEAGMPTRDDEVTNPPAADADARECAFARSATIQSAENYRIEIRRWHRN